MLRGLKLGRRRRALLLEARRGPRSLNDGSTRTHAQAQARRHAARGLAEAGLLTLTREGVTHRFPGFYFMALTPLGHAVVETFAVTFERGDRVRWDRLDYQPAA